MACTGLRACLDCGSVCLAKPTYAAAETSNIPTAMRMCLRFTRIVNDKKSMKEPWKLTGRRQRRDIYYSSGRPADSMNELLLSEIVSYTNDQNSIFISLHLLPAQRKDISQTWTNSQNQQPEQPQAQNKPGDRGSVPPLARRDESGFEALRPEFVDAASLDAIAPPSCWHAARRTGAQAEHRASDPGTAARSTGVQEMDSPGSGPGGQAAQIRRPYAQGSRADLHQRKAVAEFARPDDGWADAGRR